jgi:hypothetical protein
MNNDGNSDKRIDINVEKCSICKGLFYNDTNRIKIGLPPICIGEYKEIVLKPDLKDKIQSYEKYMNKKSLDANMVLSIGLSIYNKQRMITEKILFPYKPLYENYKENTIKPEDEMNKRSITWIDIHESIALVIAKVPDYSLKAIERYISFMYSFKSKSNQNHIIEKINIDENNNERKIKTNVLIKNESNIIIKNKITTKENFNDKNKERFKNITDKTIEYFSNPSELLKRIGLSVGIEFPQVSKNVALDLMHKSKEKVYDIFLPSIKLCGNTMIYSVVPNIYRNLVNFYHYYNKKN